MDLGALMSPHYRDDHARLKSWAQTFVRGADADTLLLLKDLNTAIPERVCYQSREDEGAQAPLETLARGCGACRDFAILFVEAARMLGFGARIVSGYLYDSGQALSPVRGAGSTHAWAEI